MFLKFSSSNALLISVSALAFCATTEAKETTLRTKDHGVLGAMYRMGCRRPELLPWVLRESKLQDVNLLSLKKRTKIVIPDDCENEIATRDDLKITRSILANETAVLSSGPPASGVRNENLPPEPRPDTLRIRNLRYQLDYERESHAEQALKQKKNVGYVALSTAIVTSMVWFFAAVLPLRRKAKELRDSLSYSTGLVVDSSSGWIPVGDQISAPEHSSDTQLSESGDSHLRPFEYLGEMIPFIDTSELMVGCPFCPERRIKDTPMNKRQHLDKHRHLRVAEEPASVIKNLLEVCA